MRSRNIKPGFFHNEVLGSADPLLGILFEGLWCMADREGRLEDRPLRICAVIFPYRRKLNEQAVDKMLTWLDHENFIRRYSVDGKRYIQVLEFSKHQSPHVKEPPSKIPALSSKEHRASTGPSPGVAPGPTALIPDSGSLIPDSGSPSLPSTSEPVEGVRARIGARRNGSRANGTNPRALGTNPRAVENASLRAWRAVEPIVDQVKSTASEPVAKRLTWDYVRQCVDPLMWQAIEQIGGCAVIANRDRFTTTKIQARFRSAFERLVKIEREEHAH